MSQPTLYLDQTPATPFSRLVQAELRKSVNTLSGFWLLAAVAVIVIIIEGFFLVIGLTNRDADLSFTIFTQPMAYVLQPLVATLTIMLVTSEWGQRTAVVTFALEPRRTRVLYAKLAAGMALMLALVTVLLVVALVCSGILELVRGDGFDWDFGVGDLVGTIVFEAVAVLIGYALATLILNTPGAIAAFPVILYALPAAFGLIGIFWEDFKTVGRFLNLQTAEAPLITWTLDDGSEWGHLLVALLVWMVVPFVVGQLRVLRAEVK